ncbi:MAG: two-component regulator propeller domain-containing protein [Balneolales bacterium]
MSAFLIVLVTGFICDLAAQPIGSWSSHSSQSTVLDILQDEDGRIWASTEGGLFVADDGDILEKYTTTEGMYRINPQVVTYDRGKGLLWLGYGDGMFEVYDRQSGMFRQFSDIARASRFTNRGVNQFVPMEDYAVIATDFGIVLFDPDSEATRDTYSNLGDFPGGTIVNAVLVDGQRFFAATPAGVAMADTSAGDLVVPENWTNFGADDGFDGNVTSIVTYKEAVYALTGNSVRRYNETEWEEMDYFEGREIDHLEISQNGEFLVAWNDTEVMLYQPDQSLRIIDINEGEPLNTVFVREDSNELLLGTTNLGIRVNNLQTGVFQHSFLPEGPYMNSFSDIHVRDGILASGSNDLLGRQGTGNRQSGYYLYRDNRWDNFNNLTHSELEQKDFHSVFTSASNSRFFFFGSWGRGVAQHDPVTDEVKIWDSGNSILDGHVPGSSFIVASGLTSDRYDNLWVVSWGNHLNSLYRFVPESEEWTVIPRVSGLNQNELYSKVTVDSYDQLWLPLQNNEGAGRGLVVKRLNGDEIDEGVILRDEPGGGNLPHPKVNVVVQDRRGEIWIGTDYGIARFPFPQRIIDGGTSDRQASLLINADDSADSPFLLRTSHVTSIAVNSANQKWIGTDGEGIWLVEEEGGRFRAVKNFTTENSPLNSNSITSVAYDNTTGQVFIATDQGLVSYTDVIRGSVAEMDELFIYPNPFSYSQENSERVVIDRLSDQTIVRVLTIDGRMVRRLETRGGRVEWDVRDFRGDRVSTGIYIIVSVDGQNEQRGIGKLVVVR